MLLMSTLLYSQGNSGGSNGPPGSIPCPPFSHNPVCGGQPGLPIDGGLPILLLVGTLFGAYTIYNKKHKIIKKPL